MNNRQISNLLKAVAAAYEINGESRFRIVAYENAAAAVESSSSEIKDLWDDGQLKDIPGFGPSITAHIDELFKTGKVKHFAEVFKKLPPAMFVLLTVPGIGPKTAYKLAHELPLKNAITAIEDLKKAALEGKIRILTGFGQQSQKAILEAIGQKRKDLDRMLLPFASELAGQIISYLKQEKAVLQIEPLGSLRRQASTIGDIDLAVATNNPKIVLDYFVKYPQCKSIEGQGENSARIMLKNGRSVDLLTILPQSWGTMLQHLTGSKQHNIHLREIAVKKDWSISQYGIKIKTKEFTYAQETEFYQKMGMSWIPPELREDTGEIEASLQNSLPNLIQLQDIKGDFHLHSDILQNTSHDTGLDSMEKVIAQAKSLGYQYLAFTEHNPSVNNHNVEQIFAMIQAKKKAIESINSTSNNSTPFWVFNSLEIDIRADGTLALPEKALNLLDFAVASVHSSFNLSKKDMTQRLLRALSHPKVKILGHPTGRMLGKREGYEVDWDKIFSLCKKFNKYLEINAWPERLDLPDTLVREALKRGVKIIISTDSHDSGHLNLMRYGVAVARRGWATPASVVNTADYDTIKSLMK